MVCETTIKQVHRQDTVWDPRVYNLRKPKVLKTNLFSCFQYFLQTKSGSNGQYENKVKRNCCQIGLVYCLFHYSIRLTTTTIKMRSFLYCIKTKNRVEKLEIYQNIHSIRTAGKHWTVLTRSTLAYSSTIFMCSSGL